MLDILTADRGATCDHPVPTEPGWFVVSRLGNLQLPAPSVVLCFQLRGSARVESREGHFRLQAGHWVVFERDSAPQLQADRDGLLLGLLFPLGHWEQVTKGNTAFPLPGRNLMSSGERLALLRLWRQGVRAEGERRQRSLRVLLSFLASLQTDVAKLLKRCPGRSHRRRLLLLARLQRVRLFLEGNTHRTVRLAELAGLSNLSTWHFAKLFRSLYRETPLAANHRLRLEHACHLLASTPLSVSDIGLACGFDNCCSFSRAFSNRYRQPPSRYRSATVAYNAVRLA